MGISSQGPLKVSTPGARPNGYEYWSVGTLRTRGGLTDPAYANSTFDHGKGGLLFWFYNYEDYTVDITIVVEKIGRTGLLSRTALTLAPRASIFVLLDGYPAAYLADSNRDYLELWVAGPSAGDDPAVKYDISRRWP
jgi:hypothetical protein